MNRRLVKTHLPLSGEVTVTGGDTEDEAIVVSELCGLEDGVVGLGGCVHLGEDVLGQSLGDLHDGRAASSLSDTSLDGLSD